MGAAITVLGLSTATLLCAGDRQDKDPSAVSWVLLQMPNSGAKVLLFTGDLAAYWALV